MLKSALYTVSAIVLAGGLVAHGPAMAADAGPTPDKMAASMASKSDPGEPTARFDVERACDEVGMVPRGSGDARSDPTESRARFDAARDCISMDAGPGDPDVMRDADPTEPSKQYN